MFSEFRYSVDGFEVRIVVARDVVALPDDRWSMGGFGPSISLEWMLGEAKLPGRTKKEREILARCVIRALAEHHAAKNLAGV